MTWQRENGLKRREVPVADLQRAFRDSGLSAAEAALRCGWTRWKRPSPANRGRAVREAGDGSRFLRTIGLRKVQNRGGYPAVYRGGVQYDTAVRIIRGLDLDPVEYGI